MTTLYLFFNELDSASRINFLEVKDQSVVDLGIGGPHNYLPEEFLMRDGSKRVFFRDGLPWGFHLPTQSEVRFKALHCQGVDKWRMPRLCQARNRMVVSRVQVFLRYGLRHLRHRLLKTVR